MSNEESVPLVNEEELPVEDDPDSEGKATEIIKVLYSNDVWKLS